MAGELVIHRRGADGPERVLQQFFAAGVVALQAFDFAEVAVASTGGPVVFGNEATLSTT